MKGEKARLAWPCLWRVRPAEGAPAHPSYSRERRFHPPRPHLLPGARTATPSSAGAFPTSCLQVAQDRAGVTPQHLGTGTSNVSSACVPTGRAQRKAVASSNLAGSWGPFSCHHC